MALALRQIKVYCKLGGTIGAVLAVLLVFWKNSDNRVSFWFFHEFDEINVLWLIFVTAVFSVLLAWLAPRIWRTWAEFRRVRREPSDDQERS